MVQFVRRYVRLLRGPAGKLAVVRSYVRSFVRSLRIVGLSVLALDALLFSSQMALAQFSQQGPKLVGTGAIGTAGQGFSVSLSSDGNTAIVGGPVDNNQAGAAWIYTRSGGVWTQQGGKLVGTGATGAAQQGLSVSLSSDGNTAIVGGNLDNNSAGAAWVYTRSGGVWTQQGGTLVGTGATGAARQGVFVSLSSANTAIVGGNLDNIGAGAAWVYVATAPPPSAPLTPPALNLAPPPCSWAGRTFSQGAIFCMGPTTAVTCDNGKWTTSTYGPCNSASPIDAK